MRKTPFITVILGIMIILAIVTLLNFAINLRAMFLLRHAFMPNSIPSHDFHQITQGMLAKAIPPFPWKQSNLNGSDWFKLTAFNVSKNNNIVLVLSTIEIALVNVIRRIRQRRILQRFVTLGFGIIACSTLVISVLSNSFGGF